MDSMDSITDCSFGRQERLKSKEQIGQLFAEGKQLSVFPIKLIYRSVETQDVPIKTAVTVSKKNFKSAVHRNRIKRLLREAYRLHKHTVFNNTEGNFAFLFLYLGKEMPASVEIHSKMKLLLDNFNARIHEKNSS